LPLLLSRNFEEDLHDPVRFYKKVNIAVWHSRHTRLSFASVMAELAFDMGMAMASGNRAFKAKALIEVAR